MPEGEKTVREIMIDVFEFPHVPYWFTVRQVSGILKKAISGGKCLRPLVMLVFDEKYNLVGHISVQRILRSLGDVLFPGTAGSARPPAEDQKTAQALQELSETPVSALMVPSAFFITPDAPLAEAAEQMHRNDLSILPVLENQKKLVGIVRRLEIFSELTRVAFRS